MPLPDIYMRPGLWIGVVLMLLALRLSYTQLRSFSADEWNSLTDPEQDRILWWRSTAGGLTVCGLWFASLAMLVNCDG